jgi:DcuC family C4-dicarboxylate transporter
MTDLFAAAVVLVTFVLIIRGAEVRFALLCAGAILVIASGRPGEWFDAFGTSMTQAGLITVILPALGFTAVIRLGKCDVHLVRCLVKPLLKMRAVIIPAAMIATMLIAIAITSAAGVAAAVGVVLIPALVALGVSPAMAAATMIAGTWGAAFSPGSPHPALIGDMAGMSVMDVILAHLKASVPAVVVYAVVLYFVARMLGEDGRLPSAPAASAPAPDAGHGATTDEPVNLLRAAMPVLPLLLLIVGLPQLGVLTSWLPKGVSVLQAMIVGTVATMLVARLSPAKASKAFFDGMGDAYAGVMGIIIAAGVFIAGLSAIGSIDHLIAALKQAKAVAPVAAMAGPFAIAVLSGSGDAAAIAFNKAMLPHAELLGMTKVALGDIAGVGSALGRGMSPVAAATAIAAGYAGVSVFDIAKRTALPAVVAAAVVVALMVLFA